jgi:hypothetical protein
MTQHRITQQGHIILINEYCSDPHLQAIARRLLDEKYNVVVIGAGMPMPRDISPTHNRLSLIEEMNPSSLKDLVSFKRSGYPEYGHYRVDFRTGKPLRY